MKVNFVLIAFLIVQYMFDRLRNKFCCKACFAINFALPYFFKSLYFSSYFAQFSVFAWMLLFVLIDWVIVLSGCDVLL